jgi:hypothetical protein
MTCRHVIKPNQPPIEFVIGSLSSRKGAASVIKGFSMTSRHVIKPNQPPIEFVIGSLSSKIKQPGYNAGYLPPKHAEIKNSWVYTSTLLNVYKAKYLSS